MPSCTPIRRSILEQEARGRGIYRVVRATPTAFAVPITFSDVLHRKYTRTASHTSLSISLILLHNSGISAPRPHTHTHTHIPQLKKKALVFLYTTFILSGPNSFPLFGESLETSHFSTAADMNRWGLDVTVVGVAFLRLLYNKMTLE